MDLKDDPNLQTFEGFTMGVKIALLTRMGWGLLMFFGVLGLLLGHTDQAVGIFVVGSVIYVVLKIIMEALTSLAMWTAFSRIEKESKEQIEEGSEGPDEGDEG